MNRSRPKKTGGNETPSQFYTEHSRHWESLEYVYPVVSRRSRGLSIGINLNPDTICNFDCVYCQVDKAEHPRPRPVDPGQVEVELATLLETVISGELWQHPQFIDTDPALKRLNDIAFSGDGEPTAARSFPEVVRVVAKLKDKLGLNDSKIILITNATLLCRDRVELAIETLDKNHGEVWAKLDAGTEGYYKRVDRSAVPYQTILNNILTCGRRRPIVIQSMFAKLHGEAMSDREFTAYTQGVTELVERGCQIKAVQIYTVARQPLEPYVTALPDEKLEAMAGRLRQMIPDTQVDWYGSQG